MVSSVTSAAAAAAATPKQSQTLGQADFIRLMTTQMKLQDPLEPVDNKEMIAQMAQFSSLSGIENINSTLKAISAQLDRVMTTQTNQTPA
ncbi:MAG: flagellar hook capping FlgD N-terminal domain-containing protein [Novosphingobium sp.]|uniref:flagellar hook assembly protein FlgD n=1 Tax=Novosphingobium sp. TaxID=1874826 RepID=UPI003C7A455A